MALGVLHQRGGVVEAHRLIVQQGRGEGGQVVVLQPGAGVGEQREAARRATPEAVERER